MVLKSIGLIMALGLTSILGNAQSASGDWKGLVDLEGMKVELVFHISQTAGAYSATLDVPAQGAAGLPMEKVELTGSKLLMSSGKLQISYEGELSAGKIDGTVVLGGKSAPLSLAKFESKLPGNNALPSTKEELEKLASYDSGTFKYKVADYFAKPKASSFQLSPNGKFLSYMEKDAQNKNHVYVKEIATGKITRAIEEKDELIKGYGWINDERLVFVMDKGGNGRT